MKNLTEAGKNRIFLPALTFTAVFAVTWVLTSLTPLIADDFNYAFNWADGTRIDNFTNVVWSMRAHRLFTHGRVFAQGWAAIFMMWPKWAFSLANATVVTVYFISLRHFFAGFLEHALRATVSAAALFWICMPAFGQVVLWMDGACNYFWGAALCWILIEQIISMRSSKWRPLKTILLIPLAFMAGAWSEHISFAALTIQFLLILYFCIERKRIPDLEILLLTVGCAGYLFLMLAPSMLPAILKYRTPAAGGHVQTLNAALARNWWIVPVLLLACLGVFLLLKRQRGRRARAATAAALAAAVFAAADLAFGARAFAQGGFSAFISSTPVGFLTVMVCFSYGLNRALVLHAERENIILACILCAGGLSAMLLFIFGGWYIPARGFCAPVVFCITGTVLLWESTPAIEKPVFLAALTACFLITLAAGFADILHLHGEAEQREADIRHALETDGVLVATPYTEKTKYSTRYGLQDLADGEYWPNDTIQQYYGLKGIVVQSGDERGRG